MTSFPLFFPFLFFLFLNYSRGGLVSVSPQGAIYKAISEIKLKGKWQKALSSGNRQDWLIWRRQANFLDHCDRMRKGETPGTFTLHLYPLYLFFPKRQTSNFHFITYIKICESSSFNEEGRFKSEVILHWLT